jgi:hypothetical protein
VDGGVVMNTPLKPAIEAGGQILHIIYMDPDVRNIPRSTLESTLDTMDRLLAIMLATKTNEDIDTAAWVNDGLAVIERVERGETLTNADLAAFIRAAGQIEKQLRRGTPYKKLTIHRYHPRENLGGGILGLLNFGRDRVAALIERGFNDALRHDCDGSQCLLPQ